jgi:pimeloyl-ACP methyl ester carboxylesterase
MSIPQPLKNLLRWFLLSVIAVPAVLLLLLYRSDIPLEKLEPKYFSAESRWLNVGDARMHIRIRGHGPAVMLIHGSFSSLHTWNEWEEILSREFTTVSMDLPGHGLTGPSPSAQYSTDAYAELLFALADSLSIDHFSVAGNSMGGQVAWTMALQQPERIGRLVLIDAAGFWSAAPTKDAKKSSRPWIFRILGNQVLANMLVKCTPRFLFRMNLEQVYAKPSLITEELIDRYYDLILREGNRAATVQRLQQRATSRITDLATLNIPTLIIWGEKDAWIPVAHGEQFHQIISGSILETQPDSGHIPMEEDPEITANLTLDFLKNRMGN